MTKLPGEGAERPITGNGPGAGGRWSLEAYMAMNEVLRQAQQDLDEERRKSAERFDAERDRRLTEVALEREKALAIKEKADEKALGLASEIQAYKNERDNRLQEQINSERGAYATKDDLNSGIRELTAIIRPLADYVAGAQGRGLGMNAMWGYLLGAVTLGGGVMYLATHLVGK